MTSTTHGTRVGGGIAHAESPECTPASSTCSITPPMYTSPVWSRTASTSTSMASDEEAVDQHRALGGEAALAPERAGVRRRAFEPDDLGHRRRQLVLVVDDAHRPAAEHVARAHEHREADAGDDLQRLVEVDGGAARRLRDAQLVAQRVPLLAVLGERRSTSADVPGDQLGRDAATPA